MNSEERKSVAVLERRLERMGRRVLDWSGTPQGLQWLRHEIKTLEWALEVIRALDEREPSNVADWLAGFADREGSSCVIVRAEDDREDGRVTWQVALEWGREAPGSPMAGGAAFGAADTFREAVEQAAREAGWQPPTSLSAVAGVSS